MGFGAAGDYMAHGYCFLWDRQLVWLHLISDVLTGSSYFLIASALLYFVVKRRDFPYPAIVTLFAAFIFACGMTHFSSIYTIYVPSYWEQGYIKAFTALVSVVSAIVFIPLLPKFIGLPSLNIALEGVVKERTRELEQANVRLQELDRLKSMFLASMSHELRTPLNSIIGFTGIMLQGLAGPVNEEQMRQLAMVKGSATHLLDLINDVLDISKIEAGELTLARDAFDIRTVIEKVVQSTRPIADNKGLTLLVEIGPGVGTITSDMRRVEQILLNLLSNAIKFTEAGKISVECRIDEGCFIVRVTDQGIGIKKEDIPVLFNPFHQVDNGIAKRYEGTGLGLSICKKLTELMGGKIWVESEWGKGSAFSFSLPDIKKEDA